MDLRLMRIGLALPSKLAVLLAAVSLSCSSDERHAELSLFLGRWRYEDGLAKCADPVVSFPLRGIDVEITAVSAATLEFQSQTDKCSLLLAVGQTEARGAGPCQSRLRLTTTDGYFDQFTLLPIDGDRLRNEADGHTTIVIDSNGTTAGASLECARFYFEGGLLSRISEPP
jgi:hypothetical protein